LLGEKAADKEVSGNGVDMDLLQRAGFLKN
jgi:hypothetical protein